MAHISEKLRTWIEIDSKAAKHNYGVFRKLIGSRVQLWAVVKSNAYGHGLYAFSELADQLGVDGFCVDSIVEGLSLRDLGIKKYIFVLGPTLTSRMAEAAASDVTVSIANFESLRDLAKMNMPPQFHIKVDTGMHRQGFYPADILKVITFIKAKKLGEKLMGVFTHFAAAKDIYYPAYAGKQFDEFQNIKKQFEKAGLRNLTWHCAATGGALMHKKYHMDAVRVGIGLYGLYPSKELHLQFAELGLRPVLSW